MMGLDVLYIWEKKGGPASVNSSFQFEAKIER